MIDARIFIDSLDKAKSVLDSERAELKGKYIIHDTIYRNIDSSISLVDEFLRLREVPENIWNEKRVILALKQTELQTVGKSSHIPLKLQYDKREEAESYYRQNLKDKYIKDFDFWRIGWQYSLANGDVVDLEIIDDKYPSIEFKSENELGIKRLLAKFGVNNEEIIKGPSVVAIRELLEV